MLDLDKETRRLVTELRETHEQVHCFLRRKLRPKSWRAWEVPLAQAQAFNSRRKRHPTLIYLVFSKETPPRLLKKVVRVSNIVFRIMYRNGAASRALSSVINLRQSRLMAKIEWPETPPRSMLQALITLPVPPPYKSGAISSRPQETHPSILKILNCLKRF